MSDMSSGGDSFDYTPATTPSQPTSRRASILDKILHPFRSRQNSDDVKLVPTQHSHCMAELEAGHQETQNAVVARTQSCELARNGMADLPNIGRYFDIIGEEGREFYRTADWVDFQGYMRLEEEGSDQPFRAHGGTQPATNPAVPNADTNHDADTEPTRWQTLRNHSPAPGKQRKRRRHDSRFSFSAMWPKSRRASTEGKAKGPQVPDPPANTPDSALHPLTKIGILPRTSEDDTLMCDSKESKNNSEAKVLQVKSINSSAHLSETTSARLEQLPGPAITEW